MIVLQKSTVLVQRLFVWILILLPWERIGCTSSATDAAATSCSSIALLYGAEETLPRVMGIYTLVSNSSSSSYYEHLDKVSGERFLLYYWPSSSQWLVGWQQNGSTPFAASASTSLEDCPDSALDWVAYPDGGGSTVVVKVVQLANTDLSLLDPSFVAGVSADQTAVRAGAVLSLDCCSLHSRLGHALLDTYSDAVDLVNRDGGGIGGVPVELLVLNDNSDEMQLREATWRLLAAGVRFLLGPAGSRLSAASAAVVQAEGGGTVLVSPAALATATQNMSGSLVVSSQPLAADQLAPLVPALADHGITTIYAVRSGAAAAQADAEFSYEVDLSCSSLSGLAAASGVSITDVTFNGTLAADFKQAVHAVADAAVVLCLDASMCSTFLDEVAMDQVDVAALVLSMSCGWRATPALTAQRKFATTLAVQWTDARLPASLTSPVLLGDQAMALTSAWVSALQLFDAMEIGNSSFATWQPWEAGEWRLAQFDPVGGLQLLAAEELWIPAPGWSTRLCYDYTSLSNIGFNAQARCIPCPELQERLWTPNLLNGRGAFACVVCTFSSDSGYCSPCPTGTFVDNAALNLPLNNSVQSIRLQCRSCGVGTFSSQEGQTACEPCPAGTEAPSTASVLCDACPKGRVASEPGSATCEPCPTGDGPDASATACVQCAQGMYSSVEVGRCADCPPGRYQHQQGSSECVLCPAGARCDTAGLSTLSNLENWWARMPDDCGSNCFEAIDKDWFPCNLQSPVCKLGERCATGGTGLLCQVCTPDYTWVNGECKSCPEWSSNLIVSISIGLCLGAGIVALTSISIGAAGKAKSLTSALLKLMLNYVTTMGYMSEVLMLVLDQRSEEQLREDPASGVRATEQPLRVMTQIMGTAITNLHSIWSLDCLWQPVLTPQGKDAIDLLASATFSERPLLEEGSQHLLEFHEEIQYRSTVFWICLTPGMIITLLVLMTPLLFLHMRYRRRDYKNAAEFYMKLARPKTRERAMRRLTPAKVEEYVQTEKYRFLGIWRVVGLMPYKIRKPTFWKKFIQDALPLFIIVTFVLYPLVLRALLDPLRCVKPTDGKDGTRWSKSLDIECGYDDPIFWSTVTLSCVWGFVIPALTGFAIYIKYDDFHNPRLQRTWGFLTGGYELDRCYWECILLVRKTLGVIVSSIQMSLGTRIVFMVALAGVFLFLHLRYKPFDNRFNELLDRIETVHLVAWNAFALALVALYMLDGDRLVTELAIVSALMCIHLAFGIMIFTIIAQSYLYAFADSYTKGIIAQDVVSLVSHGTVRPSYQDLERLVKGTSPLGAFIIRRYGKRQDRLPYIAMRQDGFKALRATVGGSRGSQCRLPLDVLDELKRAVLPPGTKPPTKDDMRYLVNILFDAFEYCVVEHEQDIFSGTLLEFVLRVGFTFGVDGNLRLQDPDSMVLIGSNSGGAPGPPQSQIGFSIASFWRRGAFAPLPGMSDLVDSMGIAPGGGGGGGAAGGGAVAPSQAVSITAPGDPRPSETTASGGRRRSSVEGITAGAGGRRGSLELDLPPGQQLVVKAPEVSSDKHAAAAALGMKLLAKSKRRKGEELVKVKRMERLERVGSYVHGMFESRNYLQGVTLEELQLNLTAKLHRTSKEELQVWLDAFETTWRDRRKGLEWEHFLEGDGHHTHGNSLSELRNPIRLSDASTLVVREDFHPEMILTTTDMDTFFDMQREDSKKRKRKKKKGDRQSSPTRVPSAGFDLAVLLGPEQDSTSAVAWVKEGGGALDRMSPKASVSWFYDEDAEDEEEDDGKGVAQMSASGKNWMRFVVLQLVHESLRLSRGFGRAVRDKHDDQLSKYRMKRLTADQQVARIREKRAELTKTDGESELQCLAKLAELRQQLAEAHQQRTRQLLMPEDPDEWRMYDI